MMSRYLAATAAAMLFAAPAFAQDADAPAMGGARIEARIGLDRPVISFNGDSAGKSGFSYGVEAGYDLAISSFVVGAYAGVDGSTAKECTPVYGSDEACIKAGRNITAGARIGAPVGRNGLLYVKGGYSNGRVTGTYRDFVTPANNDSISGDLDGFHVGAGYEMNFTGNVYGKVEYVYTNYDTGNDLGVNVDLQRHQGLVGVGLRF